MPDELPKIPRQRKSKNKPIDTPWRQQRLAAKRPVLTIQFVFPWVLVLGFIIFGLGLLLYFSVEKSLETKIHYTDCKTSNDIPASTLARLNKRPQCIIDIYLEEDYENPVKFQYQLDGFYQNFRTYLASRNDKQLIGELMETSDCDPLACVINDGFVKGVNASCNKESYLAGRATPIVPCGTIANSMFNDTFELFYTFPATNATDEEIVRVPFSIDNVLSKNEREKKFKNPDVDHHPGDLCEQFKNTTQPPAWQEPICKLGVSSNNETDNRGKNSPGEGLNNIDFQVWMKAAALPNFRKPYRTLDKEVEGFANGLPAGNYTLVINYNYPVDQFKIKKYFVISRESWIGPKNFFLPIIYMVTGVFIILSFTSLFVFAKCRERFGNKEVV